MTFYKQTNLDYKKVILGFGAGSIYDYGCYEVSLTNGLQLRGYSYDPIQVNDILKIKNLWTGTSKNLIDVAHIVEKWGDIFTDFKRIDNWGNSPSLDEILQPNIIAIGEVDAAGIGGTPKGQHFVLITKKATNGHAIIYDPWRGIEEIIDTHWGNLGYIKGLRLFYIKPHIEPVQETENEKVELNEQTKYDFGSPWGKLEMQAVRSKLNDMQRDIDNLTSKILSAKKVLG